MKEIFKSLTINLLIRFMIYFLPFCACIAVSLILYNDNLSFEPSSKGFNNFLDIFKFPISLMAAFLALLTINLTITRTIQTDIQLNALIDNNRFNNYYRLNENFIKFFEKQELFLRYKNVFPNNSIFEVNDILQQLFKCFYGASPIYFTTKILPDRLKLVKDYLSNVYSKDFFSTTYNLRKIAPQTLSTYNNDEFDILNSFIKSISDKLSGFIYANKSIALNEINQYVSNFYMINELYLAVSFFSSLLIFEGESAKEYNVFRDNYRNYLISLNIPS